MEGGKGFRVGFQALHELEELEIQEEEKYIENLQLQRVKIEEFRAEIQQKNGRISELESELHGQKSLSSQLTKYASEIAFLTQELKESELENAKLRSTISAQVDDYDNSIRELQEIVLKEREENSLEISNLKSEVLEKERDLETVMAAFENAKFTIETLETRIESELNSLKSKEKSLADQNRSLKNIEKTLRDENSILRQENLAGKEAVKTLSSKLSKTSSLAEEAEGYKVALNEEKRKIKELSGKYSEACGKYEKLKSSIDAEFSSLKAELDQAVEIITRQESSLKDLRHRKQEDDLMISQLNEEIMIKDQELSRLQKSYVKKEKKEKEDYDRIESVEAKNRFLVAENAQFKAELQKITARQEREREERKVVAKKKLELISQRNEEISRLNQVFNSIDL